MTEQTFDTIKVNRTGRVITVELNRPDALNALNSKMTEEVTGYLASLDEDKDTGCFVCSSDIIYYFRDNIVSSFIIDDVVFVNIKEPHVLIHTAGFILSIY